MGFLAFLSLSLFTIVAGATSPEPILQQGVESLAVREYFYVGGRYVNATSDNVTAQFMVGQIYVEKLTPQNATQRYPIVFVAGAGQTGTNFLNTPDGREGWASYFLRQGYTVYLTDQPERGRSAWLPGSGTMTSSSTLTVEQLFTAPEKFKLWPQAYLHTQWPGATGLVGDPVFDAFYATQVQLQGDRLLSEANNAHAYARLFDRIGAAYLVTHSQSGAYGWRVGDARPELVKAIVALEPSGPPFVDVFPFEGRERTWGITDLEITYEPSAGPNATDLKTVTIAAFDANHTDCILQAEPAKKLVNLAKIPVFVMTGEASFHAPYEYCTVDYLRQAGVNVTWLDLPDAGIHGNGHMIFIEKNSLDTVVKVRDWLQLLESTTEQPESEARLSGTMKLRDLLV